MAQREDDKMRRELRAPEGAEALTYSFHFQISNKGGRQACSVEVLAPNVQDATMFFRQNLPHFESIARDHLVNGIGDCRTLKLAAQGQPNMPAARRGRLASNPKRVKRLQSAFPCAAGVIAEGQGGPSESPPIPSLS